ncbi:MAG TPA: acylphosphatase [Gemmataceae bacterium]|jgi:acylphosphatase|nr:acylphosphatase [Gemmataceae bacterium]
MERRAITVQGVVQGVGFRPFIYRLASELGLCGYVMNRTGDVWIEVESRNEKDDNRLPSGTAQPGDAEAGSPDTAPAAAPAMQS